MKLKNIIMSCVALFMGLYAQAAAISLLAGSVKIDDLKVERSESRLLVSMNIDVAALKQGASRETVLTPVLKDDEGNRVAFPSVTVAGRNRYYSHLRNDGNNPTPNLFRSGKTSVIPYSANVAYEQWMERAELAIEEDECGCAGRTLLSSDELLQQLDFKQRVFAPQFVFITPQAEMVKAREIKGSAYIDFPVNRTEIYPDYRRNPEELAKIRQTIDVVRNDADTRITALSIKGYASPEGSYSNNVRLAKGRTETLKNYVQSLYAFEPGLIRTSFEPEDWEGLRRYLETSGIENRDLILALVDSDLEPDAKDARIKRDFPRQYAFLLAEVYPGLRHSDYTVEYVVRSYTDVEEIKALMLTAPQKLSLQELFLVAQSMEPGTPEYMEVFEIAVRMYPDDPVANLNAANSAMQIGDYAKAARYLLKAGNDPQAIYARGVLAGLQGDYDAAESYLKQAARLKVAVAPDAVEQLEEMKKYNSKK